MASCIVLAATMTGCGNSGSGKEAGGSETVTLRVLGYKSGEYIGNIEEVNREFEKRNPGTKVVYEGKGGPEFKELLKARAASRELADVVMIHPGLTSIGSYAKAGYLADLSNEPWAGDISENAKSVTTFDGKLYGLPNDLAALGVYYNKKVFNDLGIDIPKNYDEFLAVCDKIKQSGITPIALNKEWQIFDTYTFAPAWIYAKHPDFDEKMNSGEAKFTGLWEEMLTEYKNLYKNYASPDALGLSGDGAQNNFVTGKAAMLINGSWAADPIKKANPDLDFGMFPMPNKEGEVWAAAAVGTTWAINKDTKYMDLAKKYLEIWAEPEYQAVWAKSQNSFPTNLKAKSDLEPGFQPIVEAIERDQFWRFLDQGWLNPNLQTEFNNVVQNMLFDKMDASGVTKALDAEMEKYMKQNQ